MTNDDYQAAVARTVGWDNPEAALAGCGLGLAGEVGELVDHIKKHLFHGHSLDKDYAKKEMGDVLWYLTALASEMGLRLGDIMAANDAKLRARYPEGFDKQRSINRTEASAPACDRCAGTGGELVRDPWTEYMSYRPCVRCHPA